jgi:peptidoglycan LD-endopeptidase LytH
MEPGSKIEIPVSNRKPAATELRRSRVTRKRRSVPVVITAAVLLLLMITGVFGALVDTATFYARVARLYALDADTRISMPLEAVAKRQIADTWHAPRGTDRQHEGQDIFAPKGTPVLSATSGYIYKIGWNNLGGQTVSVIGAGGRVYYYAHLDSYASNLNVGDPVSRRTVLGYVGTTGNAQGTPPHLHFGVYTFAGAINPLPLLNDRTRTVTAPPATPPRQTRPLVSRRV